MFHVSISEGALANLFERVKAQIWIIGSREQVNHLVNECYVRKLADDRVKFTPIAPDLFSPGKCMSVLVR